MTEKRNIEIKVRLNRKEADQLCKRVKRSRLSREAYLRHLINDMVPQEAPPSRLLCHDAAYRQFETAVKEITEAVVQPKPMEQ